VDGPSDCQCRELNYFSSNFPRKWLHYYSYGKYYLFGSYNGFPLYQHFSGGFYLFSYKHKWLISSNIGSTWAHHVLENKYKEETFCPYK